MVVRLLSGAVGDIKVATLTVHTKSVLFVVTTTQTIDTTPSIFIFDATTNVEPNTVITSNEITVSDITSAAPIQYCQWPIFS